MDTRIGATNKLPLSYLPAARWASGRIAVPVVPGQALYANFKHVSGVASGEGAGFSVEKLKILDALIERLSARRAEPILSREDAGGLSPERADALIEQYVRELKALAAKPYASAVLPEAGALVSLAA